MYLVYILISVKDGRTYVGYSADVQKRLCEHNSGKVKATQYRRPFRILFTEKFDTKREAKKRELWWKSSSGRNELKRLFE